MRQARLVLALAALAAGVAGCESISGPGGKAGPPLTGLPRQLSVAEQQVIEASNRFAFDLLRETSARDTAANVVLSPLSASMALGMTMNGARGETLDAMRATLGFGALPRPEINASYASLIELLLGLDAGVEMRIANALWVRRGFPLRPAFVEATRDHFGATLSELDFADPASLDVINGWASRSTNGRIATILDEPIPPHIVMYLMNAIYFKGTWTRQFDARQTQPAPFRRADGTQQQVRMMRLGLGEVRTYADADVEVVDLPYGRGAYAMTLVLPRGGRPLDEVVARLDAARWDRWIGGLAPMQMEVHLPRFRVEYEKVLNETLGAMGMDVAFSGGADFGDLSPVTGLSIDEVLQKTFLEVNEEGTEAAAVTSVSIGRTSGPPTFRADRPFLLAIRERFSGTILFLGRIGAPPAG
jgi:serine protease inhibitor